LFLQRLKAGLLAPHQGNKGGFGMSREASNAVGAGAVMSAGIATGVVGGASAAGGIMNIVRKVVIAGDQGWDRDGIFICSKFAFNFRTQQVFDGKEMHAFEDITSYSWDEHIIKISIRGRIEPKAINVGMPERCQMIGKILEDIWAGVSYEPEKKRLLPTFRKRVHRVKIRTAFRYAIRSFFLGIFFGIPITGEMGLHGDPRFFGVLWFMAGVFALSVAWRKFKPVKEPVWQPAT
jgi:hypothetical protein